MTTREFLRELFAPPALPLAPQVVWAVCVTLMALAFVADLMTPASLAVGTVLSAAVAFSMLGGRREVTWQLTALALTLNLAAGLWNAQRDGLDTTALLNRLTSLVTVFLVGALTLRAREASERGVRLEEDQRQLTRERTLRALAQSMGGPLGQSEFVERAAPALLEASGALRVEIGAVEKAMLRGPHALAAVSDDLLEPSRLGSRIPLEYLAHPAHAGNLWAVDGGHTWLARLRRPSEGDLLIILSGPKLEPALLAEAVGALQPLLERTVLLDDLRENRAQLERRGEVMRDLIYAFSHDLRTPLMANAMNMRAALGGAYGPLPEEYRATLRHGLESNAALLSLAEQLLEVARFESGQIMDDPPEPVPLRPLVEGVLAELEPQIQEKGIELETSLTPLTVPGWPHELRRAVQNLAGNAIKFVPPGGRVRVQLSEEYGEAVLRVADNGAGVPLSQEAQLFRRFRGSGAGSGKGLGLYLTRQIALAHGGQVSYRRASGEGGGSRRRPLQRLHPEPAADVCPTASRAQSRQNVRGMSEQSTRILIVEDHPFTRDGLRAILNLEPDLDVVAEARSGEEALELLEHTAVDLVIMDIGLPGMDGIEAVSRIRARWPQLHTVMLTAHDMRQEVLAALASGAQAYCLKSASPELLLLAVRAAASGSAYLDPQVAHHVLGEIRAPYQADLLTARERQVLRGIAEGQANREIAADLGISTSMVKLHVQEILDKLQAADRTQAAVKALRSGMI